VKLDADKVRWQRDSRGWTLETTAKNAEVALGTVLRAEHGEDIRPSSGRRIARAFDVDISELVPDRPGMVRPKASAPSTSGQPEGTPEAPIVKESAASTHMRTEAAVKPRILYILRRVAQGEITPEEGTQQLLEEIIAA
jgi:transcriptional regulator with XRE-family HTH domain